MTTQGNSAIYNMTYPNKVFQDQNGVCPVKSASNSFAIGNNQTLINGVTSKILRVLGILVLSDAGSVNFKNGSGGTALMFGAITTVNPILFLPLHEIGYFETTAGTGLFVDVVGGTANITVQYVEYQL